MSTEIVRLVFKTKSNKKIIKLMNDGSTWFKYKRRFGIKIKEIWKFVAKFELTQYSKETFIELHSCNGWKVVSK